MGSTHKEVGSLPPGNRPAGRGKKAGGLAPGSPGRPSKMEPHRRPVIRARSALAPRGIVLLVSLSLVVLLPATLPVLASVWRSVLLSVICPAVSPSTTLAVLLSVVLSPSPTCPAAFLSLRLSSPSSRIVAVVPAAAVAGQSSTGCRAAPRSVEGRRPGAPPGQRLPGGAPTRTFRVVKERLACRWCTPPWGLCPAGGCPRRLRTCRLPPGCSPACTSCVARAGPGCRTTRRPPAPDPVCQVLPPGHVVCGRRCPT